MANGPRWVRKPTVQHIEGMVMTNNLSDALSPKVMSQRTSSNGRVDSLLRYDEDLFVIQFSALKSNGPYYSDFMNEHEAWKAWNLVGDRWDEILLSATTAPAGSLNRIRGISFVEREAIRKAGPPGEIRWVFEEHAPVPHRFFLGPWWHPRRWWRVLRLMTQMHFVARTRRHK